MRLRSAAIAVISAIIAGILPASAQFKNGAYAGLDDSETVSSFKEHVSTISAAIMEGRKAGSEGEAMTAEYVTGVLKEYGVDILSGKDGDPFGILQADGDTLTSRNVIGFIQGSDKTLRNKYIVIGARMDNLGTMHTMVDGRNVERIFYGANGNASGLAMMLELGRMLQTNHILLRRSVLLIGFGASCQTYAGAWYFLNRAFSDAADIDAMINLDMVGTGGKGFYAYTSSNADMNRIVNRVNATLQPVKPEVTATEPVDSDHRMFYASEIPSVLFTTGMYPEYGTVRDTPSIVHLDDMELELEYIYNFTLELANGAAPSFFPDRTPAAPAVSAGAIPYYECDIPPTFLGSTDPKVFLEKWVYAYLKYPQEAVRNGVQGRVLVDFVIDEKGKMTDVKVLKGVDPLLDAEAVKVVSASPDWKPARLQGRKVRSEMSLYVEFKLEKRKNR